MNSSMSSEYPHPQVEVRFRISGEFDPDEVTRITGVVPSSRARRGERIRTASVIIPIEDRWTLKSEDVEPMDGTSQVEARVRRLWGLRESLLAVKATFPSTAMGVTPVAYVPSHAHSAVPNLSPDNDTLRQLADLGIDFGIDYMLLGPEDERDS